MVVLEAAGRIQEPLNDLRLRHPRLWWTGDHPDETVVCGVRDLLIHLDDGPGCGDLRARDQNQHEQEQ